MVVMVVVSWVPEGSRGRQESKSACDSSTDGIRAWHGGAREGRSVQARLFNGVVGQQREESRLQNTVPLLPKKSGALCNPKPAIFGFFLCKLPHLNPSHFLHPPPHNFLTLTTSLSSPNLPPELQDQSPHPTPIAVLLPSLSPATATLIITSQPL